MFPSFFLTESGGNPVIRTAESEDLPVQAQQPLAGFIAPAHSMRCSLSVTRQMVLRAGGTRSARTAAKRRPARASTAAACRVYRTSSQHALFAVRYPANVCSCKHGSRLPGLSHKKTEAVFSAAHRAVRKIHSLCLKNCLSFLLPLLRQRVTDRQLFLPLRNRCSVTSSGH